MTETTRTGVAATRIETLDAVFGTLWALRTEDEEGLYEGLDAAISAVEVMMDEEYDRVKVQENIVVKYSFNK